MIRFIVWLHLFWLCPFAAAAKSEPMTTKSFYVVGYYSMKEAMNGPRPGFPFASLSHVNLYFLNPDAAGKFPPDFSALLPFVRAAHTSGVKVMASIGGGSAHPYYHALLQADKRQAFEKSLLNIVRQTELDGIDIDLEGEDMDSNYDALATELGAALHAGGKLLTAAIAVFYKDMLSDHALAQYDFVNLMSYDHTGEWEPAKPGQHSSYADAVTDLAYFRRERHIPAEKITLGVGFYGYSFGPEKTSPAGSMNYGQIVQAYPAAAGADEWKLTGGATIYYNGMPTIKKKIALAQQDAGGMMIWQLDGDAAGKLSLLKVIGEAKN